VVLLKIETNELQTIFHRIIMEKAISRIQFIKNAKVPVCLECAYFIQGKINKCLKFGEKNVVSGKVIYVNAETARSTENMCSGNGIYFEKNKTVL